MVVKKMDGARVAVGERSEERASAAGAHSTGPASQVAVAHHFASRPPSTARTASRSEAPYLLTSNPVAIYVWGASSDVKHQGLWAPWWPVGDPQQPRRLVRSVNASSHLVPPTLRVVVHWRQRSGCSARLTWSKACENKLRRISTLSQRAARVSLILAAQPPLGLPLEATES